VSRYRFEFPALGAQVIGDMHEKRQQNHKAPQRGTIYESSAVSKLL